MKRFVLTLAALAALQIASFATVMELAIAGSTKGAFDAGSFGTTTTLLGLGYSNSTFNVTTSNGFAAIGNVATPGSNFNNLGSFTLNSTANIYTGHTFTLQVLFTQPTGIVGGNTTIYSATLIGSVTTLNAGGVKIDFDNTPKTFTFTGSGGGTFSFEVNDLSITAGQTAALTGDVRGVAAVPEVSSLAPLGLVLLAVAGVELIRRRRAATI